LELKSDSVIVDLVAFYCPCFYLGSAFYGFVGLFNSIPAIFELFLVKLVEGLHGKGKMAWLI
jgi:hypothetical protein